jgi:hypothetical protein
MRIRTIFLLFFFGICPVYGQSQIISNLEFPLKDKLPKKFQEAIEKQTKEYYRLFRNDTTTKNYSTDFILEKIDKDKNYHYIFVAEYWIAFHYQEIIPALIEQVSNKKEIGLENTADLIIWERIAKGDLKFYGSGGISQDDLFTIAGRANRLLIKITGENFGYVSMYSTQKELEELQTKWTKWLDEILKMN